MSKVNTPPKATDRVAVPITFEKPDSHRIQMFAPDSIAFINYANDPHGHCSIQLFDENEFADTHFNTLVARVKLTQRQAAWLRERLDEYLKAIEESK